MHQNTEKPHFHFSYLHDIKIHGIYYNSFKEYIEHYSFIKEDHSHDFYSFILFTKGNGRIKINDSDYPVRPQTISLIAPNQSHSLVGLDEMEGIILFFCQDFYVEEFSFIRLLNVFAYTSTIDQNLSTPCIDLSDKDFNSIISAFNSIQYEYESCTVPVNPAAIIRSFLNIILLKLSGLYEMKTGKSNKYDSIIIHSLSHLVDSYYIREQHIGFYASAFNIPERRLNDICHNHFNCSLKRILRNRLMQEARKLLLSSEFSVAEIAYKLNFEDNSYFNKVFKSNTGLTPKRFREIHRKLLP
ncbi:MAG: AraC family transcriptional regulator [Bacteroidales bacterium]|nr:AraC family transcriptional regulator [Bacteroidales bacterium]